MKQFGILIVWVSLICSGLSAQNEASNTVRFYVAGACEMCADRIIDVASGVPGVRHAEYSLQNQEITVLVEQEKFNEESLHESIAQAGHNTSKVKAPAEAYESLPLCCHYTEHPFHSVEGSKGHPQNHPQFGKVLEMDDNGHEVPIVGAHVYWSGTSEGVITDEHGIFVLPHQKGRKEIVVSYVGFGTDTLTGPFEGDLKLVIEPAIELENIEVTHRQKSIRVSYLDPIKVESISESELLKAACCNLSESFETNPSVDVSFTDAVTGTRQIQMLGLAGPNVQIMRENVPDIRGLSALYGFTYTPGPWIEGIQLSKGTGSVVNGFESITGQINVELRKPESSERLYLNIYGNQGSRLEANLNMAHSLGDHVHTGLLLHGSTQQTEFDRNNDGFMDMPLRQNLVGINRWKFILGNYRMQAGFKATYVNQTSGQLSFDPDDEISSVGLWGAYQETQRLEGWMKIGRVYPGKPYKSIGLQMSGVYHDQDARFGGRPYAAMQRSAYVNLIYQSIIGDTDHQVKFGLSSQFDQFDERIAQMAFEREEFVPGAFFEYTFLGSQQFSLVAGLRADHHNIDGLFITPRLHARFAPAELTVFRLGIGRGRRTPSIFAENIGLFASAREIRIEGDGPDYAYGLTPEVAWNIGLNFTQGFMIYQRAAVFSMDFYRTQFSRQVVVDYDLSPRTVVFYPLDGNSFSNSLQIQFDYEFLDQLDIRVAYRFNDVRMQYQAGLMQKPLIAQNRAFINLAYETGTKWKFDATFNLLGQQRIPMTNENPRDFQLEDFSPSFLIMNAQISKTFGERFEAYLGAENLLNFMQENPILAANDPNGDYFDASMIWGPVFGRNIYAGIRYRIPR